MTSSQRRSEPWNDERVTTFALLVEAHDLIGKLLDQTYEKVDLSSTRFELLLCLARSPGQRRRLSDLASQLVVTTGGVTRLVDRCERDGLVKRMGDCVDGRVTYAVLTARGMQSLRRALPLHLDDIDTLVIEPLGDRAECFAESLRLLRDHAAEALKG